MQSMDGEEEERHQYGCNHSYEGEQELDFEKGGASSRAEKGQDFSEENQQFIYFQMRRQKSAKYFWFPELQV